ncbi:hypothetical protein IG631_17994 [Alternaria alternata]|nr:hypothetical protein IG631_17994 [Alternaria alternata]
MPVGSSHRLAMRSANALPMADTLESTMSTPCTCWLAASMTLVTFPTPILEYAPRSGLAQAQPVDIYSLFLSTNLSGRSIFSYNHRKCLVLDRLSFPIQSTTHHVKSSPLAAVP